jgi:hypothetical protein
VTLGMRASDRRIIIRVGITRRDRRCLRPGKAVLLPGRQLAVPVDDGRCTGLIHKIEVKARSVSSLRHGDQRAKTRLPVSKGNRRLRVARGRGMNISYKPIALCFVFAVLGSTFAAPMTRAETGCHSYEKKTAACHAPISKPCVTRGYARCRLPNTTKDDWPAGMILGNSDFMLSLRPWLSA